MLLCTDRCTTRGITHQLSVPRRRMAAWTRRCWPGWDESNAQFAADLADLEASPEHQAYLAALAEMQAADDEWIAMLEELQNSPGHQLYLRTMEEMAERQSREYAAMQADMDAMTPDWIG
jgi:hypothetical protein